jgi:flavin-dependent dehydrogenase
VREKFEAHGFQKKYGAYLAWGADEWQIVFGDPDENIKGSGYGFEVVRSEFDHLLLEHSKSQGADVREGVKVTDVLFDDGRPTSIRWAATEGSAQGEIAFDYLVDASGRAGILSSRYFKNRRFNEGFKNVAAYGYWRNAKKATKGPQGGVLVGSIPDGWVWGIPLHDGTLSVGVVLHSVTFRERRAAAGGDLGPVYAEMVAKSPLIAELLVNAELVGPIRYEQDFSYMCERACGPRYFITGDAAHFLDPLLSSGVHLATTSGLLAAAAISTALRGELSEQEVSEYYDAAYRLAYVRFLVLVSTLYRNYRGKESLFWQAQQMIDREARQMDLRAAFKNVVTGLEDMDNMRERSSELVMSEMSRLVNEYFPKDAGKTDDWLRTLPVEEQKRLMDDIRPLAAPVEYCLSEETALNGYYVQTKPRLAMVRVAEKPAKVQVVDLKKVLKEAPLPEDQVSPKELR